MQINTTSDALDNLNKKLGGADIEIEPSTNKVDALKKIYKTLGGTDDVAGLSTVYQVLEKITEAAEGGGGSSDFSTAEVTIIDNTEGSYGIYDCPVCVEQNAIAAGSPACVTSQFTLRNGVVYKVPLYKGVCVWRDFYSFFNEMNIELDGAISQLGTSILITGNGTITLTE